MNNYKSNIEHFNGLSKTSEKKIIPLYFIPITAALLVLVIGIGIASTNTVFAQTNATTTTTSQQQSSDKSGTITSVQTYAAGKWNLAGNWTLKGTKSASPIFNASFSMAKLDGSAKHKHQINDFKVTGSPITNSTGSTYTGTATVSMK